MLCSIRRRCQRASKRGLEFVKECLQSVPPSAEPHNHCIGHRLRSCYVRNLLRLEALGARLDAAKGPSRATRAPISDPAKSEDFFFDWRARVWGTGKVSGRHKGRLGRLLGCLIFVARLMEMAPSSPFGTCLYSRRPFARKRPPLAVLDYFPLPGTF